MEVTVNTDLCDKYRDINVDGEWWDYTYESFVEKMQEVGVEVDSKTRTTRRVDPKDERVIWEPEIFFSGFCSQGDGACFNGRVYDWGKFLTKHFKEDDPSRLWLEAVRNTNVGEITAHWSSSGHYCHEYTLSFSADCPDFYDIRDEFDTGEEVDGEPVYTLEGAMLKALDSKFSLRDFEDAVADIIRDYCRDLYHQLEEEYEYLTSDEAVWEMLVANGMDEVEEEEEAA